MQHITDFLIVFPVYLITLILLEKFNAGKTLHFIFGAVTGMICLLITNAV